MAIETDELVKRLRGCIGFTNGEGETIKEAATALEAMAAKLAQERTRNESLTRELNEAKMAPMRLGQGMKEWPDVIYADD